MENCRRLGINPKEYLTDVLTRRPACWPKKTTTQPPAKWLAARTAKAARQAA